MANIITHEDHKYKHYNRALGCKIESKKHYEYEMKRRGMVSKEVGDELARQREERRANVPKAELSDKAREIIQVAKRHSDKKGRVKFDDNTIEAMKELGVGIGHPRAPKPNTVDGGFE